MVISLGIILFFMVVEIVGGIISGSLALLADAGHMATDAGAIALALVAMWVADRPSSVDRTFGFARTEILAAFLNILTLWLISGWVIWEAVHRIGGDPHVEGVLMTAVGVVGLVVNIFVAYILHGSSEHSLNVQGAFLHVLGDLLGSVAVIVSGIFVLAFGWHLADPIVSVLIGIFILALSYRPAMQIFHILIEGVPAHIDLYALCHDIESLDGVTVVHDVHAWTITSGYDSISAHILIDDEHPDHQALLDQAKEIAREKYHLSHITFQVETSLGGCTEDHHVGHLEATARG
ncbi:MAG: cation diffusion facilitator family transporter [Chloroflexota bacterium]|nr:cation diffusion facilitator family transporter [Chloroflexota bacterium]